MEKRIELPSGGWAMLRDPRSVTNRERKPLLERVEADANPGAPLMAKLGFGDRLVCLMVASWSYDFPLPRDHPEALEDVPGLDLDALYLEVMKPENMPFLDTGDRPDPKASAPSSPASPTASSTATSTNETISLTSASIG